jgi:hypothetical protein
VLATQAIEPVSLKGEVKAPQRMENGRFLPGHKLGRPLGSRNKLEKDLLKSFAAHFREMGKSAIEWCFLRDPVKYMQIAVSCCRSRSYTLAIA